MNFGPVKKSFLFVILTIFALVFIGGSVWLLNTVNAKQDKVANLVNQITLISDLEVDLILCLESSETVDEVTFENTIEKVVSSDFNLAEYPQLEELAFRTSDLKKYFKNSGVLMNFQPFQDDLQSLYFYAVELKQNKRREIGGLSYELSQDWNTTFLFISFACLQSVLLAIISFVSLRSRKRIRNLLLKNSLFIQNAVDAVIICNNKQNVVEINSTAKNTFGYTKAELLKLPLDKLYVNQAEAAKVNKALKEDGFFKGEVINVKKDGTKFISHLSANVVYDENQNPTGTMGISRDITDQKRDEEQFQHIVDNATDIIYTTNAIGAITYINSSANSVFGYKNEEVIGKSFRSLIHPDYVQLVDEHYQEQFRNNSDESYLEFKMIKSNGEEIWVGQNVRTRFNPTNKNEVVGFFGVLRNLDEIKRVQLELKDSEKKFRELFDNSTDLIQSIDSEGKILFVNDAWKNILGYNNEDVKEMNLFDIIHPDSKEYSEKLLSDILKDGTNDDRKEHIFRMLTKSGDEIILKGTLDLKFEKGQVTTLQAFFRDHTALFETEQELAKSQENFNLISESINDVFFLYDLENEKYDYISPNCKEVLGADATSFYSGNTSRLDAVIAADHAVIKRMQQEIDEGKTTDGEYRLVFNNAESWIAESWFPIKNGVGKTISIAGTCRNVTEMKDAYDTIYVQNKEINQSIQYAKHIQESTLPTPAEIAEVLTDCFVYYSAKDVLSGDLYVVENVKGNDGTQWPAFVVGDCTGHGVPGGVLSLLCGSLVTESLTTPTVNTPAQALDFVRSKLIRLFRSNPEKYILDGMDAAFGVINSEKNLLYFSGANLSCFIVHNGEVNEYRGDKQHIGYSENMAPFVNYEIEIAKGDIIYFTTDGYVDQFGGPKNKKYLKKRFTELLLSINHLSMEAQKEALDKAFISWKGENSQTDDVALIGVRIA